MYPRRCKLRKQSIQKARHALSPPSFTHLSPRSGRAVRRVLPTRAGTGGTGRRAGIRDVLVYGASLFALRWTGPESGGVHGRGRSANVEDPPGLVHLNPAAAPPASGGGRLRNGGRSVRRAAGLWYRHGEYTGRLRALRHSARAEP